MIPSFLAKGINVFPTGIARAIEDLAPAVTGEFQVLFTHPAPYTQLDITVEHGAMIGPEEKQGLKQEIEASIKRVLNFTAVVELVEPQSIKRTEMGKAIRVLRRY